MYNGNNNKNKNPRNPEYELQIPGSGHTPCMKTYHVMTNLKLFKRKLYLDVVFSLVCVSHEM